VESTGHRGRDAMRAAGQTAGERPTDGESFEALNCSFCKFGRMKRLIITGDPGIRRDAVIEHDGEELTVFQINRNGEWHGPEEVQLWCVAGGEDEREQFDKREYIPHFLDVERLDAGDVTVVQKAS
jgi:hypothetical protein